MRDEVARPRCRFAAAAAGASCTACGSRTGASGWCRAGRGAGPATPIISAVHPAPPRDTTNRGRWAEDDRDLRRIFVSGRLAYDWPRVRGTQGT
ncbi:hypothetical protein GUJ93_ZPchr0008g14002 [Zizania palustris]|uniref:Uncharacterized protein n=1 Tax=Zizania palustris TaxID=103762 RepID=A0A8J5V3S1_ZIZPA|nr:hypothetical protein GUJ93_ZPchr0008g14002 [Zizania palustris]